MTIIHSKRRYNSTSSSSTCGKLRSGGCLRHQLALRVTVSFNTSHSDCGHIDYSFQYHSGCRYRDTRVVMTTLMVFGSKRRVCVVGNSRCKRSRTILCARRYAWGPSPASFVTFRYTLKPSTGYGYMTTQREADTYIIPAVTVCSRVFVTRHPYG